MGRGHLPGIYCHYSKACVCPGDPLWLSPGRYGKAGPPELAVPLALPPRPQRPDSAPSPRQATQVPGKQLSENASLKIFQDYICIYGTQTAVNTQLKSVPPVIRILFPLQFQVGFGAILKSKVRFNSVLFTTFPCTGTWTLIKKIISISFP